MRLEDLTRATGQAGKAKSHTFVYAIDEAHLGRIRPHTGFSLIAFGTRAVRAIGSLGHPGLDTELQGGVPLDAPSPRTRAYPFSIHDDLAHIDQITAQGIRGYLVNRPGSAEACLSSDAVADWILCATHPLHDHFSPEHRAELVGAIRRSILRLYAAGAVGAGSAATPKTSGLARAAPRLPWRLWRGAASCAAGTASGTRWPPRPARTCRASMAPSAAPRAWRSRARGLWALCLDGPPCRRRRAGRDAVLAGRRGHGRP